MGVFNIKNRSSKESEGFDEKCCYDWNEKEPSFGHLSQSAFLNLRNK